MLEALNRSVGLLGSKRFGFFWFGSLLSNIGTWMQQVAEPWLVLSLSGSPILLGLDAFAMDAPIWVLTLVGGLLADRADRKRVITFFQAIQMFCPLLLVLLILTGWLKVWMIIVLSLIVGITDALSMPAFQSIVPLIVEPEKIGNAIALNSTQFNLSRIFGPVLAGLVMAKYGAVGCFATNALSYLPFLLVISWIRLPRKSAEPSRSESFEARPWYSEFHKIASEPVLRGALLTVFVTSLLGGPLVAFSPVLIKDVFRSDASHFGGALSAFGVGGLIGAIAILGAGEKRSHARLCSAAAILYGVVLVAVSFNPYLSVLSALLVLAGAALTASNISANSLLQGVAPDGVRGRVASVYMLAMRGGLSLGNLMTGFSVHFLGVRHALLLNGAVAIALQIWTHLAWSAATEIKPILTSEVGN